MIYNYSKCSTKPFSLLLTKILTAVKEKLQENCATEYLKSGVNQMWFLKNSKELLENFKSQNFTKDPGFLTSSKAAFSIKTDHVNLPTLSSVICIIILLKTIRIVHKGTLKWILKTCLSF